MSTTPPFRVDGPPYPTNLPFFETEALALFVDRTKLSLPYSTNANSVALVKKLYEAGANKVIAIVTGADTDYPLVREMEVHFAKGEDRSRLQQVLDDLCRQAMREGRLIQVGAGGVPDSIGIWWEDV